MFRGLRGPFGKTQEVDRPEPQVTGVQQQIRDLVADRAELSVALQALLQAGSAEAKMEQVALHPELLSDEANRMMRADYLAQSGDFTRMVIELHQDLLRRCRVHGVEQAFGEYWTPALSLLNEERGPHELVAMLLTVDSRHWRRIVEDCPALLSSDAQILLEELRRSGTAVNFALAADQEDKVEEALLLVRRGRMEGIDTAFTELGYIRFLRADRTAWRRMVEKDRGLLTQEAVEFFGTMLAFVPDSVEREQVRKAKDAFAFLQRCQKGGVDQASAELQLKINGSAERADLLRELEMELEDDAGVPDRIAAHERVLAMLSPEENRMVWARLNQNLGGYLARSVQAEGPASMQETLERAAYHTQQALQVYTKAEFPQRWANLHLNLGQMHMFALVYDPFLGKTRDQNAEQAISHLESAAEVFTREADWDKWTSIQELKRQVQDRTDPFRLGRESGGGTQC